MQEEWKTYPGLDHIEISSMGRQRISGQVKEPGISPDGYRYFRHGAKGSAHRVVARMFIPNPENKPCVNHISGDKSDNRVANLEWCTHRENIRHMYDAGITANASSRLDFTNPKQYSFSDDADYINGVIERLYDRGYRNFTSAALFRAAVRFIDKYAAPSSCETWGSEYEPKPVTKGPKNECSKDDATTTKRISRKNKG